MSSAHAKISESEKFCKHCKKTVKNSLDCEKCGSSFHRSCAFQAKVADKNEKVYCCKQRSESEVSPPENPVDSFNLTKMDEKTLKQTIKSTLVELIGPFKKDVEKSLGALKTSVQFMSDSFEDQKKRYEEALHEIKALQAENNVLKTKISILETKFDQLEQKDKANNIVIVGVPEQREKNTKVITKQIFTSMDIDVSDIDICESFRVNKKADSMILVKLANIDKKQEIMRRIKELRGTTVTKCGLEGINKKIYLNDDMTTLKRQLFKKARDLKKDKGYKAAYTLNGNIFLKKKDGDTAIKILSEESLRAL